MKGGRNQARPLVTFALFAYNQDRFIGDAIKSAFSQEYEPLEIILSDDCSSDATFSTMEKMADQYTGRHRVIINRTPYNMGVANHVISVCRKARGDIVVVAAGDDISYKNRVAMLVAEFQKDESIYCVTSGFDVIDENENYISKNNQVPIGQKKNKKRKNFLKLSKNKKFKVIQGSTASYKADLFSFDFPKEALLCAEDNLFNFAIYANGKDIASVSVPLIAYRQHDGALSNFKEKNLTARDSEIATRTQLEKSESLLLAIKKIAESGSQQDVVDYPGIESELESIRVRLKWKDTNLLDRFRLIFLSLLRHDFVLFRWQIIRFGGAYPDYVPQKYLNLIRKYLKR